MPQPGIQWPSAPLVGGTSAVSSIFENYVFQSGIYFPEFSRILTYKYPQYYLTTLLDKMGAAEPVSQDVFSWDIMDRTRKSAIYTAISGGTSTAATLTLDTDATVTAGIGYFQVGDVIRVSKTGQLGVVTAIGVSGSVQTIVVAKPDGSAWATSTLPAVTSADSIGHMFSAFGEGTNGPAGRVFLPTEDYNYTQIIKRSVKVTGSEMTNKTILGDGRAWYFTVEDLLMKEFARDREILLMFGVKASSGGIKWSRGIYDWVNTSGQLTTYSSTPGVTEADLQSHIAKLLPEGGSAEYLVLCGSTFLTKVMNALRDYKIFRSTEGSLEKHLAGLDFHGYVFAGKTIYFAYYELFDDNQALPYSGTPSSTAINFKDFSLWLDMGADNNGRGLIKLKYKVLNGVQRKFIHKVIPGMMTADGAGADGGFAANSFDGVEIQLLSEIGLEFRLPNRCGVLRANS